MDMRAFVDIVFFEVSTMVYKEMENLKYERNKIILEIEPSALFYLISFATTVLFQTDTTLVY